MADFVKGLFGAASSTVASAVSSASADADFADFASAAAPEPVSHSASMSGAPASSTLGAHIDMTNRPFTKWYRVWERVTWADFKAEAFILPLIILVLVVHVWGTRKNRRRAKAWIEAHASAFDDEFAAVGFGGRRAPTPESVLQSGLARASEAEPEKGRTLLKEKSKDVFLGYATGRNNVAFADIKLNLLKRYSPFALVGDNVLSFFFDSMPTPLEKAEITMYAFDGRETAMIPLVPGSEKPKTKDSTYDGFVFAIVHKDHMKRLRDERYDVSLTTTKDHAKLPQWVSVMSESAEITETLLNNAELVKAVQAAGDDLESLIITDMPEDAPKTLDELQPKKRMQLNLRLSEPSNGQVPATLPLLQSFLRLPDTLVSAGHFRPEVLRRVRATRDDEAKKIKKVMDAESADERKLSADKAKKEERDRKMRGMTADEQRKFLEREKEKEQRKKMGRKSVKA